MSRILFKSEDPRHFLVDSKGDMYEISEELATMHADLHPRSIATVDHIDKETKTIWFTSPLPPEVKA
jgi:hypothetical protein